jgi:hypothetical protein
VVVVLVLDHFRGHVFKSSTKGVSLLHVVTLHTPSEITNLNNVTIFNKNILWLDISVDEALLVQIVNARAYLNEEVESRVFT